MDVTPTSVRRVLVCEDADDARFLLAEMLRSYGFDVSEAARGDEAIELLSSGTIDVALIDIGLPDMNGFEVARRVRQNPVACRVRLIAVTGYGTAADRESSRSSGFDHHLLKPATIEQLLDAIGATPSCDSPSG